MSTTIKPVRNTTSYSVRSEGTGFLFYIRDNGAYLYSSTSGREVLEAILGSEEHVAKARAAQLLGISLDEADIYLNAIHTLLRGEAPAGVDARADRGRLGVWLLQEHMGPNGERCETFGMPF